MVELRSISKYFPSNGVTALKNADLALRPGEIHALLGENGTGKSTLMHIMAGYLAPSSGTVSVNGVERRFHAPADALALGIGMVRQHPGFIQGFKVWEDCILGAEKETSAFPGKRGAAFFKRCRGIFLDPGKQEKRARELSGRWNFDLPLDREAGSLTVSQRQKAAVLGLLLRDVKWFIFDEPTAVLTPGETGILFELFRRLREEGRGIILITHKLEEALGISDRVTVIRGGVTQGTWNSAGLSTGDLEKAISGEAPPDSRSGQGTEADSGKGPPAVTGAGTVTPFTAPPFLNPPPGKAGPDRPPVLVIKDLALEPPGLPYLWNVNLSLRAGTITGITGVRDSGLETLELAITGLLENPGRLEGSITLNGHAITGKGVRAFRKAGGAYLGADRLGKNSAPGLPLKESLIIHAFRRAGRGPGFLDKGYLDAWCRNIMDRAGIERPVSGRADSFSGGMLQRILLAREFAEGASLVVLAEAGSGLDGFNRSRLEGELKTLARKGTAVLLFSTDADWLRSVADGILVLKNGVTVPLPGKAEAV